MQIGNIDYYKVRNQNDKSDVSFISKKKIEYNQYYKKGEFSKDGRCFSSMRIFAEFDESLMVYKLNNGSRYEVLVKIPGEAKQQKRDLPPQARQASINSFDRKFFLIDVSIKNEIQKIIDEGNIQENQYNSHLFADSNKYYDVVFQELIQAKTDLNNLLGKLNEIRKRYQN